MESDKKSLKELKKRYNLLKEKYSLPEFEKLNENFQIEKICDIETDLLAKEIRKVILEKFFDYFKLIESLLNPAQESSLVIFAIAKKIDNPKKEKLIEIYKKISFLQFDVLNLDLNYSEKKEVDSIKKYLKLWEEIKPELISVFSSLEKELEKSEKNNISNYLG